MCEDKERIWLFKEFFSFFVQTINLGQLSQRATKVVTRRDNYTSRAEIPILCCEAVESYKTGN